MLAIVRTKSVCVYMCEEVENDKKQMKKRIQTQYISLAAALSLRVYTIQGHLSVLINTWGVSHG